MLGVQQPSQRICPEYEKTYGLDAGEMAAAYGLTPDPWQQLVLNDWLAYGANGKYAAETCGLSVPRQNGKNGLIEIRELYGAAIEGEKILHTAHEVRTSRKAFDRLCSFFEDEVNYPELAALVIQIRKQNGYERILLDNGGSIEFSSRSRGAARGYTVDVVICDEAQELTDEQLEALLPTKAAAPLGNSQLILTGTPPAPSAYGQVFKRTRKSALEEDSGSVCWLEWGVSEIGNVSDRNRWAEANPALGYRISEQGIESELAVMSDDGFARERLGWWSSSSIEDEKIFDLSDWQDCECLDVPEGRMGYGVKFTPDGGNVSISVAILSDDADPYVELIENRETYTGTTWLADFLVNRWKNTASIVIDGRSSAQQLADEVKRRGVPDKMVKVPRAADVISASSGFLNLVREHSLSHIHQTLMNERIANTSKRMIGNDGGWGFKDADDGDISPVDSVALALWGVQNTKRNPSRKQRLLV